MCGSPGHLIRDCPAASSPYSMLQQGIVLILLHLSEVYLLSLDCLVVRPLFVISGSSMFPGVMRGYAQPYCCGSSLPHVRPFWNLYGNIGMMPFNIALVPAASFAVPMYMPAMYGGFPAFRLMLLYCFPSIC